jgi:hypothetical protein
VGLEPVASTVRASGSSARSALTAVGGDGVVVSDPGLIERVPGQQPTVATAPISR